MTDEDLNKRIHEIMGLCWHESTNERQLDDSILCRNCGEKFHIFKLFNLNTDFVNTWEGFGILWEFIRGHEQWEKFLNRSLRNKAITNSDNEIIGYRIQIEDLISPPAFAKIVVEFFEDR